MTEKKPRSCVTCAQRKVRCDKQHPCSRCQHAGIPCFQPSPDPRPRFVRNLAVQSRNYEGSSSALSPPAGAAVDHVLTRVQHFERLLKDMTAELEEARSKSTTTASSSAIRSPKAWPMRKQDAQPPGRVILDNSDRVRYVTSGFWSHIEDELGRLKNDLRAYGREGSEDAFPSSPFRTKSCSGSGEAYRAPSDRHSFLFKQPPNVPGNEASSLLPMASQIPYLVEVYSERVHFVLAIPHLPSLKKLVQRSHQRAGENVSSSEEALLFAVYYTSISSLEDEEVATSFRASKDELLLKYRTGLEQALAKADFLSNPSDILVQALIIFLALARRNDSPKFAWMMTGLAIRMSHYLGMHQDGAGSEHLTPFQVEMRRRIWSNLCALDQRVTEDLGTDLAISQGSYNTRRPLYVNDVDIWPEMRDYPPERQEWNNVTVLRVCHETGRDMQDMMAADATESIDDRNRRIDKLWQKFDREFFCLRDRPQHPAFTAMAGTERVILNRLTLIAYPPLLNSSPGGVLPMEIRTKLLVAAMEVLEHNHALNSDPACQPWKWVYQTQTPWHAVIYLLIEICRRPWSSMIERAWLALKSPWVVPTRAQIDKNDTTWAPVRKLMAKVRRHREDEINRLRNDVNAAIGLFQEDQEQVPVPSTHITFPAYFNPEKFHEHWLSLIGLKSAANTANSIDSSVFAASNDDALLTPDASSSPSTYANNTDAMFPQQTEMQPSFATMSNNWPATLPSEPWPGDPLDLSNYPNLDALLRNDTQLDLTYDINMDDALDVDWNSWIASAKELW